MASVRFQMIDLAVWSDSSDVGPTCMKISRAMENACNNSGSSLIGLVSAQISTCQGISARCRNGLPPKVSLKHPPHLSYWLDVGPIDFKPSVQEDLRALVGPSLGTLVYWLHVGPAACPQDSDLEATNAYPTLCFLYSTPGM
ncbi:hypothetical protein AJ80_07986 [Polytolypa hystricis UAMH7299]|uniref:Uncharacterized protein n=1 Tax=Polytolypa hystricis (strain UAMH7299) TaxID=1447883 RepID=A0A2B7XG04_POLH7|nr:hypothetical protein AJ80_07986 [Polytolypa hystricis UAMH7299]